MWHHVPATSAFGALFPMRMPTATALAMLSLSTAVLTLDVEVRRIPLSELLAAGAMVISLLALIAYTYGAFSLSAALRPRPLAFHSVLLLLALSVAVLIARADAGGLAGLAVSDSAGGVTVRRLLPAAVAIPAVVGWISLEGERAGWYPSMLAFAYFAVAIVVVFGALIWITAESVHVLDIQRASARDELDRLNADLERRVTGRTLQLEAANKELEAFSYSVSHDLRAPLRAIDGFTGMLLSEHAGQLDDDARRCLERVQHAGQRMSALVDDLLSLARVGHGAMQRHQVDISAMAETIVADLRRDQSGRAISVRIQAGLSGDADPNLLRIAMTNLLGNAWKFTGNTPDAAVGLDATMQADGTVYRVYDNGAGFDMAYADKLFGAFQRLHSVKDFEGTGIGLATVRRIVHRHGGRIWATGAVGQGASFYFTLPPPAD
jgi:signal transduction histidine kinase